MLKNLPTASSRRQVSVHEDEPEIRQMEDLNRQLEAIIDRPEQPGDAALLEDIAAKSDALTRALETAREARAARLERERRITRLRMFRYVVLLICITAYLVMAE